MTFGYIFWKDFDKNWVRKKYVGASCSKPIVNQTDMFERSRFCPNLIFIGFFLKSSDAHKPNFVSKFEENVWKPSLHWGKSILEIRCILPLCRPLHGLCSCAFTFGQFFSFVCSHCFATFILNKLIATYKNAMLWFAREILNILNSSIIFTHRCVQLDSNPCSTLKDR